MAVESMLYKHKCIAHAGRERERERETDKNEALVRLSGALHATEELRHEINRGHIFQVQGGAAGH